MTRFQVIKEIMQFIEEDDKLDFEEKLVLIRAMIDLRRRVRREVEKLRIILLRLRYNAPQDIPLEWARMITLPPKAYDISIVEETKKGKLISIDDRKSIAR